MRIGHAGRSLLLLSLGVATAGCFHASAKTVGDAPPLEMPSPPPRVVEVVEATPLPQPFPLVEEPAHQPVRPPPRAEAPPPPRPEPPRPEPPATVVEPPKVADEAKPPKTLQMTRAGAERDVERAIRGAIARATADLKRVNTHALNADARTQYETARFFIGKAEEALKQRNLVVAQGFADKAQSLAVQLAPR
jgi:hypothetical protein